MRKLEAYKRLREYSLGFTCFGTAAAIPAYKFGLNSLYPVSAGLLILGIYGTINTTHKIKTLQN